MENRRLFLAMALSIALILGWGFVAEKMGWQAPRDAATTADSGTGASAQTGQDKQATAANSTVAGSTALQPVAPAQGKEIRIETPLYKAVLYTGGGILRSFELKEYSTALSPGSPLINMVTPNASLQAPLGLTINGISSWTAGNWQMEEGGDAVLAAGESAKVRLIGELDGMHVSRVLIFKADTYTIEENVSVVSPVQRTLSLGFTLKTNKLEGADDRNMMRVSHLQNNSFAEESDADTLKDGVSYQGGLGWGGIMNNYFISAICTTDPAINMHAGMQDDVYRVIMEKSGLVLNPGQPVDYAVSYYIGSKKSDELAKGPAGIDKALDYGMFSIIARPLVFLLKAFYNFAGNYGLAIILLTIVIKIALWPLSQKSFKSMEKMKKLQPMLAKLRDKYKDDKTELNQQMMQLYKTYNVSPLGGCLPMLLQLPVFVGLYQALLNAIELRHAPFIMHLPFTDKLWLADLAVKDPFWITPIIMGISMLVQQKMTPSPGDPMQAKIMMLMPVVFTVMFVNFPSGLVIYWLTNNILAIAQQGWMLRKKD